MDLPGELSGIIVAIPSRNNLARRGGQVFPVLTGPPNQIRFTPESLISEMDYAGVDVTLLHDAFWAELLGARSREDEVAEDREGETLGGIL